MEHENKLHDHHASTGLTSHTQSILHHQFLFFTCYYSDSTSKDPKIPETTSTAATREHPRWYLQNPHSSPSPPSPASSPPPQPTLAPAADSSGRRAGSPDAAMMEGCGRGDPVEDFLIGGAGDDGEDLAAFCDGGLGIEDVSGDACGLEHSNLGKRGRDEPSSSGPKSKACREKMRRDKLNDRFLELCSVMNSGQHGSAEVCSASKQAKLDKASILSDAARMLTQLRGETEKLKESNENLREAIKDLKVEKNELRDEKVSLKAEKEKLEQQIKAASVAPTGFIPHMPHPAAFHPAAFPPFAPPYQVPTNKGAPMPAAFPGMAMWHWLPPTAVDTTQDPKLWPPNA